MTSLRAVRSVEEFLRAVDAARADPAASAGTAELGVSPSSRAAMREALQQGIRHQRRLALVPVALAACILVVALILVVSLRDSPATLAAVFAASGLSLSLPCWQLVRTLRELWSFELAAAVTPELDNEALADVLRVLMKRMRAPIEVPREAHAGRGRAAG